MHTKKPSRQLMNSLRHNIFVLFGKQIIVEIMKKKQLRARLLKDFTNLGFGVGPNS